MRAGIRDFAWSLYSFELRPSNPTQAQTGKRRSRMLGVKRTISEDAWRQRLLAFIRSSRAGTGF